MQYTSSISEQSRRGVILLVVMALLSLFAAVGISFVIYAEMVATSAKYNREAVAPQQPDVDPELMMNYFLSRFIHGDENQYSALRGNDLATSVYGWNPSGQNETPFNGMGRLHYTLPGTFGVLAGQDNYRMINLTNYPDASKRDPENYGGQYVRSTNVPWTYPDLNNVFLAMVNADGEVLVPSYHRPWTVNAADPPAVAKYTVLYPHSSYHQFDRNGNGTIEADEKFPDPGPGGHVKNLDFSPGTKIGAGYGANDSYWVDGGFPVLTAKDGRKYKPLFAVLATDLDGKLNVNAAGNIRGVYPATHATRAGETMHTSNGGYGPWEINASAVLQQTDWKYLFTNQTFGRYGGDGRPQTLGSVLSGPPGGIYVDSAPPIYARTDIDGWDHTTSAATAGMTWPTGFAGFPTYSAGYEDGNALERTNHAALYNPIYPANDDHRVHISQLEALLRYAGTGSPALLSDLFQLTPSSAATGSFNDPVNRVASKRSRLLVTTDSWDFARPGSSGWLQGAAQFGILPGNTGPLAFPKGTGAINFPNWQGASGAAEFAADWGGATRSLQASKLLPGRLLINRPLADYPAPDVTSGRIVDAATFNTAQSQRQSFAKDLFEMLRWVTMGYNPTVALDPADEDTHAWLAQLAVNIVDYRDGDDYMTPFEWDTANHKWVYGTELPKLVINEVYSEIVNDPADAAAMTATMPYHVNFWAELLNPLPTDGSRNNVQLQMPTVGGDQQYAIYKLTICEIPDPPTNLFVDKATGAPDPADIALEVSKFDNVDAAMYPPPAGVDQNFVMPVDANYSGPYRENKGFYLLGPKADFPSGAAPDPGSVPQATLRVMEYAATATAARNAMMHTAPIAGTNLADLEKHNILLRRLACPHLLPQSDSTQPLYNPYITVDYVQNVETWDAVRVDNGGDNAHLTMIGTRKSMGRKQPYAAHRSQQVHQAPDKDDTTAMIDALVDQPQHTFFKHNSAHATYSGDTLQASFDWLVHLDRYLNSPIELLHVNCFKPYELTQFFVGAGGKITDATNASPIEITSVNHGLSTGEVVYVSNVGNNTAANGSWKITKVDDDKFTLDTSTGNNGFTSGGFWSARKFQHQAPWLANGGTTDTRLYRLFEYLDAGHRAAGVSMDGRFPGKINLNTADWSKDATHFEMAMALCDPQSGSSFNSTQVQAMFQNLMAARLGADGIISDDDRPFRSLATGHYATGEANGVDDTLLRRLNPASDAMTRLLEPTLPVGAHPWQRYEVLSKIFNNVTTRSNVFAVWVTVGFFEVLDDNARPVKLGPEIGFAQNRHIRHRMFGIVDRSQLRIRLWDTSDTTRQRELTWATPAITAGTPTNIPTPAGSTPVTDGVGTFQNQLKYKTLNGRDWTLAVGSILILDANTANEEAVYVTAVNELPYSVTVNTIRDHTGSGGNILIRGNMGPWTNADFRYDMRKDTEVVRYFSVIK